MPLLQHFPSSLIWKWKAFFATNIALKTTLKRRKGIYSHCNSLLEKVMLEILYEGIQRSNMIATICVAVLAYDENASVFIESKSVLNRKDISSLCFWQSSRNVHRYKLLRCYNREELQMAYMMECLPANKTCSAQLYHFWDVIGNLRSVVVLTHTVVQFSYLWNLQ